MDWVKPSQTRVRNLSEVRLAISQNSRLGRPVAVIRLKADIADKFSKNERILVAVSFDKTRIWFKGDTDGWKLIKSRNGKTKRIQTINKNIVNFCTENAGSYEMHYDRDKGLHYIEVERKEDN